MIIIEKPEGTETVTRIGDEMQFWKDKGKSRYSDNMWLNCDKHGMYTLDALLNINSEKVEILFDVFAEYPEGTEVVTLKDNEMLFWKDHGKSSYNDGCWQDCKTEGYYILEDYLFLHGGEAIIVKDYITPHIKSKLHYIEQWLKGYKIQYQLGVRDEAKQWHNFTEGAMQYIKRPDIHFRIAPKFLTINGILFKDTKSLLKYVSSNFDLTESPKE